MKPKSIQCRVCEAECMDERCMAINGCSQAGMITVLGVQIESPKKTMTLPVDSAARKGIPLVTGCLDYFPAALAEVAKLSKYGNDKHNPGQPLHHARGKSTDHADCIGRHMVDRDLIDPDTGLLHMTEVCWRALALLQEMLEARGAPLAKGAKLP